jgi:transposase-like protein
VPMARVEVITGPERRRRWSEEQKRAIVAESLARLQQCHRKREAGAIGYDTDFQC